VARHFGKKTRNPTVKSIGYKVKGGTEAGQDLKLDVSDYYFYYYYFLLYFHRYFLVLFLLKQW
jgi:hypothetical protein